MPSYPKGVFFVKGERILADGVKAFKVAPQILSYNRFVTDETNLKMEKVLRKVRYES